MIRTGNCHEFQASFLSHAEDLGTRDADIKPTKPNLNGRIEQSVSETPVQYSEIKNDELFVVIS